MSQKRPTFDLEERISALLVNGQREDVIALLEDALRGESDNQLLVDWLAKLYETEATSEASFQVEFSAGAALKADAEVAESHKMDVLLPERDEEQEDREGASLNLTVEAPVGSSADLPRLSIPPLPQISSQTEEPSSEGFGGPVPDRSPLHKRWPGRRYFSVCLVFLLVAVATASIIKNLFGNPAIRKQSDTPAIRNYLFDRQDWKRVEGGVFEVGCSKGDDDCYSDEKRRMVQINSFEIQHAEVTNGDFQQCVQVGKCSEVQDLQGAKDMPVAGVSFLEAEHFCQYLNARLPTEEEWEVAARTGISEVPVMLPSRDSGNFGNDECCRFATGKMDRWEKAAPVGSFPKNRFGLLDMVGNVAEWTSTTVDEGLNLDLRVVRGGSFLQPLRMQRPSARLVVPASLRSGTIGLRCVRTVSE